MRNLLKFGIPIFILSIASLYLYTGSPLICGNCHLISEYKISWTESKHGDTTCLKCHAERGYFGRFKARIEGFGNLISYLSKTYATPKARIENENCLSCHFDVLAKILHERVEYRHETHIQSQNLQCTFCHYGVVHFKVVVEMESCIKCHDGVKASSECNICHRKIGEIEFKDVIFSHSFHEGLNCEPCHFKMFSKREKVSMKTCGICHDVKTEDHMVCGVCHDVSSKENCQLCHIHGGLN
ncbi:MAG: cytochrome c3 family protein [Candidatus Methanofastidiosia archaeon]